MRQTPGTDARAACIDDTYRRIELVVELDERGVDVDGLAGRAAFVTAAHDASRIVMGEHIEEKFDMLTAVPFYAATPGAA